MLEKRELVDASRTLGISLATVEKDYIISWVLAAISSYPQLAGKWIFKGGTCLKKCYLRHHRFSEDLDFTTEDP